MACNFYFLQEEKNNEEKAERQEERKTNCDVFENKKAESNWYSAYDLDRNA